MGFPFQRLSEDQQYAHGGGIIVGAVDQRMYGVGVG
jgi:hypothetical protein